MFPTAPAKPNRPHLLVLRTKLLCARKDLWLSDLAAVSLHHAPNVNAVRSPLFRFQFEDSFIDFFAVQAGEGQRHWKRPIGTVTDKSGKNTVASISFAKWSASNLAFPKLQPTRSCTKRMATSGLLPVLYAWLEEVGNGTTSPSGWPSHSKPLKQQRDADIVRRCRTEWDRKGEQGRICIALQYYILVCCIFNVFRRGAGTHC